MEKANKNTIKLAVAAVNVLVKNCKITLEPPSDGVEEVDGSIVEPLFGKPAYIEWWHISYDEITVRVTWDCDTNRAKYNMPDYLDACDKKYIAGGRITFWLERRAGCYIQADKDATHIIQEYCSHKGLGFLKQVKMPAPEGFATHGRFFR